MVLTTNPTSMLNLQPWIDSNPVPDGVDANQKPQRRRMVHPHHVLPRRRGGSLVLQTLPLQVVNVDLEDYQNRKANTEEWMDLLIHSIGLNPGTDQRDKFIQLSRLILTWRTTTTSRAQLP